MLPGTGGADGETGRELLNVAVALINEVEKEVGGLAVSSFASDLQADGFVVRGGLGEGGESSVG